MMKKIVVSTLAILTLASCSSTPLEKASLEYTVTPKQANYQYEFNLAIAQPDDARGSRFVLSNDNYFEKDLKKSISNIMFEEIRTTHSFNTVKKLDKSISFNPTSAQIQEVRRKYGKDALLLTQINKFSANIRNLSDSDSSNLVNLTVFTNISYKLILADSETIIFLTTEDTTSNKVVPLDENIYRSINELALRNLENNITNAKNDFLSATKAVVNTVTTAQNEEANPAEEINIEEPVKAIEPTQEAN